MQNKRLQGIVTPITAPKFNFNVPKGGAESAQAPIPDAVGELTDNIKVVKGIESSLTNVDVPFCIDKALPLDPAMFPNLDRKDNVKLTIPNVMKLLESYGITVRYNVISKKLLIAVPGHSGAPDNADNVAMSQIFSLAFLNGMPTGQLPHFVAAIGDKNLFNPVAEWIMCKDWDCVDRFPAICATLVHRDDYPESLKNLLLRRWLISAVAAVLLPSGFRARGVLTFQGPQSIGKTAWISALVPDEILRESVVKLDHHIDGGNKDTLITAVGHWLVEFGELESSFKKNVARLKGFITCDRDKIRRPYGRTDSVYPRRTVFAATVNDGNFLVDPTGNTRWWTIPVVKINYEHGIDMQQLWAQVAVDFKNGEPWWLTQEEEALLELHNKDHCTISVIHERVLDSLNLDKKDESGLPRMTATQLLIHIGIKIPTNPQSKECAAVLREYLGEPKKINGFVKWRIPLAQPSYSPSLSASKPKSEPEY